MISYGLDYLRTKGFKKVQPPFFMNKAVMGKTAQLEEFDEALYKVSSIDRFQSFVSILILMVLTHSSRGRTKTLRSTSSPPLNNLSLLFTPTNGSINPTNNYRSNTRVTRLVSEKKLDLLDETFSVSSEFINSKRSNKYVQLFLLLSLLPSDLADLALSFLLVLYHRPFVVVGDVRHDDRQL